jgi:hypothetical protein
MSLIRPVFLSSFLHEAVKLFSFLCCLCLLMFFKNAVVIIVATVVVVGKLPSLQGVDLNYFHCLITKPTNKSVISPLSLAVTCTAAAGKHSP